jgi:hypothetical protein
MLACVPAAHHEDTFFARESTIVTMHPMYFETLVRARTEHLLHEAEQERLAQSLDCRKPSRFRFLSLRRPTFAVSRPQLVSQAGC